MDSQEGLATVTAEADSVIIYLLRKAGAGALGLLEGPQAELKNNKVKMSIPIK